MSRGRFYAILAALGIANGLIRPVCVEILENGFASALLNGFGTSVVIWGAAGLGLSLLWRSEPQEISRLDIILGVAACLLYIIPVASVSWCATATVLWAAYTSSARENETARCGLAVLIAVALRQPVSAALISIFSEPLLAMDAQLATVGLRMFHAEARALGNLIEGPDGHMLLVLTGCSSFANLSIALLGWFALTRTFGDPRSRRALVSGLAVAAIAVTGNGIRLLAMAYSPENYVFLHDEVGAQIFVMVTLVLALLATLPSIRKAPRHV